MGLPLPSIWKWNIPFSCLHKSVCSLCSQETKLLLGLILLYESAESTGTEGAQTHPKWYEVTGLIQIERKIAIKTLQSESLISPHLFPEVLFRNCLVLMCYLPSRRRQWATESSELLVGPSQGGTPHLLWGWSSRPPAMAGCEQMRQKCFLGSLWRRDVSKLPTAPDIHWQNLGGCDPEIYNLFTHFSLLLQWHILCAWRHYLFPTDSCVFITHPIKLFRCCSSFRVFSLPTHSPLHLSIPFS